MHQTRFLCDRNAFVRPHRDLFLPSRRSWIAGFPVLISGLSSSVGIRSPGPINLCFIEAQSIQCPWGLSKRWGMHDVMDGRKKITGSLGGCRTSTFHAERVIAWTGDFLSITLESQAVANRPGFESKFPPRDGIVGKRSRSLQAGSNRSTSFAPSRGEERAFQSKGEARSEAASPTVSGMEPPLPGEWISFARSR
jgi:hypothetical protein